MIFASIIRQFAKYVQFGNWEPHNAYKCVFIQKLYNTVKGTENYGIFHFSISVGMILVCLFSVHTDTF